MPKDLNLVVMQIIGQSNFKSRKLPASGNLLKTLYATTNRLPTGLQLVHLRGFVVRVTEESTIAVLRQKNGANFAGKRSIRATIGRGAVRLAVGV